MTLPNDPARLHRAQTQVLVDREQERSRLGDALDQLIAGRGGLILIGGEAGIGKTSLVSHLKREAEQQSILVLHGGCYDLITTRPYGPWLEITAAYPDDPALPPLPEPLEVDRSLAGIESQQALFKLVSDFLTAVGQVRPTLVVLEDLHWADAASLELLRVVSRGLPGMRVLLIASWRDEEISRGHPLYRLMPVLAREPATERITVGWFDPQATRELIESRYQLQDHDTERLVWHVQEHSQGNPLFMTEMLRALEDEGVLAQANEYWHLGDLARVYVPPLIRQVIDTRLERFSEEARRTLCVAAVIGQEVDFDVWQDVGSVAESRLIEILEQAIEAHLLVDGSDGTSFTFSHAIIREALYESLVGPRRRAIHIQVAERLLSSPQSDPDAVAYHFSQAGDPRAVEWLLRAAERARHSYALLDMAERYESALPLLEGDEGRARERGWILFRAGMGLRYADPQRARAHMLAAAEAGKCVPDPLLTVLAEIQAGYFRQVTGEVASGIREVMDALQAGDAALRAGAFDGYTMPPAWARDPVPSIEAHIRAARQLANQPEHPILIAWGTIIFNIAGAGNAIEARQLGEQLAAIWPPEPERAPLVAIMHGRDGSSWADLFGGLGTAYALLGQPDKARQAFAAGRDLYHSVGHHQLLSLMFGYELDIVSLRYFPDELADRRTLGGQTQEALAAARGALPDGVDFRLDAIGLMLLEGDWNEAHIALETSLPALSAYFGRRIAALSHACLLAARRGDTDRARDYARELLAQGSETSPGNGPFFWEMVGLRTIAGLDIDAGDLESARAWIEAYDRWLEWSQAVVCRPDGALLWARYHRARGDTDAAQRAADRALSLAKDPRQPLQQLAIHRFLGELNTQTDTFDAAEHRLISALSLADACDAPYERALTLLALAELAATRDSLEDPIQPLDEAREVFERLGAQPALERVYTLLKRLRRRSGEPQAGLSARETEVLRLIATGMSNGEIADQLHISVRTIERHITNLYGKIGARNRADATTFAIRHDLV